MRHAALAILGLVSLGGCAGFLTPSGSAATRWAKLEKARADKASGVDARKICKTMSVMGSNFPQKVCSTQAEWDQFNEQTRQSADEFDVGRRSGNTGAEFEQQSGNR